MKLRRTLSPFQTLAAVTLLCCCCCPLVPADDTLTGLEPKIVGGFPALQSSTKHQVSVRSKASDQRNFGSGHICGGSLISNLTILTAAHCLVDNRDIKRSASYFRVVGGNTKRLESGENTMVLDVAKVVVHERYNPLNFDHDIGLLILNSPVPSGHPTLQPITLATVRPSVNAECQVTGWGTTKFGVPTAPNELLAANITVYQDDRCKFSGLPKAGMFCVGDLAGNRDSCQGDSGGPLVCNGILAGVVSHGLNCSVPNYPGVYVDVAHYLDWIARNQAAGAMGQGLSVILLISSCLLMTRKILQV